MSDGAVQTLLSDYKPANYLISNVKLTFDIGSEKTLVRSHIILYPNPLAKSSDLILNGEEMELLSVKIDGKGISDYLLTDKNLTLSDLPKVPFTLEIENRIDPAANTALDGLYKSGELFCTQNEPQGFRRITYFIDRPDVMAIYETTIIADKKRYPILLSNGNCIHREDLPNGRHLVSWRDPFKKPCYLFALVAGDLGSISDQFITCSGKKVDLIIYCDKGNELRCHHAMKALKQSLAWDEKVFGLEYDLDIFMIVAVDAFNMGAMENKGLNIFNTSCILASPESETDANFERVQGVVAHEYFHNWTGNRVTCRDWFQLTLKEGLTVFRDQEFSSDMNSRPVKRIEEVQQLRAAQFAEDAGPTAHPIKPKAYLQINNFYTPTIYDKGAEVIRMIQTLISPEAFRKGIDKYFELYDGQAVTTEDFIHAMQLASGFDFTQFMRWYHQAGTPHLNFGFTQTSSEFQLTVTQKTEKTADGSPKLPFHMPLLIAFYNEKGEELTVSSAYKKRENGLLLEITKESETFTFPIKERVIPSLNRNFSAPVIVEAPYTKSDYALLMAHESDLFNRFEMAQEFALQLLLSGEPVDSSYLNAYKSLLLDSKMDRSIKALSLTLPSEGVIGGRQKIIDFDGNRARFCAMEKRIAEEFAADFARIYQQNHVEGGKYSFDPESVGARSLKNTALRFLCATGDKKYIDLASLQYDRASNMTDKFAALSILVNSAEAEAALADFYSRWKGDLLVMNKWFAVQALSAKRGTLDKMRTLRADRVYDESIPNFARALLGSYIENHTQFHQISGDGYRYIADCLLEIDPKNPNMASRLAGGFRKLGKLDPVRRALVIEQLERISKVQNLSTNVREVVTKCLTT